MIDNEDLLTFLCQILSECKMQSQLSCKSKRK